MFNAKKITAIALAFTYIFSAVNVFAASGSKILYDEKYTKSPVTSIPIKKSSIAVEPSKDFMKIGDTFSVDFKMKNNPGFASYGFTVEYDGSVVKPISGTAENCKVMYPYTTKIKSPAIDTQTITTAIENKSENSFSFSGYCSGGSGQLVKTDSDGLLFTIQFEAIAEGKSSIGISGLDSYILVDNKDKKLSVYADNASITVVKGNSVATDETTIVSDNADNSDEVSTEAVTEVTTEVATTVDNVNSEGDSEETTFADFVINVPVNQTESSEFKDMAQYPWAKDAVEFLASLGVVRGTGWKIFSPDKFTSRADFMVIVKRFVGIDGVSDEGNFEDVQATDYFAEAVNVVTNCGLTKSTNDNLFRPKDEITRQEVVFVLAKVLEKAGKLEKSDVSILNNFIDGDFVSPYAREYVANMIGMGIVSGNDLKRITPVDPITRAEVCVLVKKVYDLIK